MDDEIAVSFETIPIPTAVLAVDGTILAVNPALLAIAERDLVGRPIQELSPGVRWDELVAEALAGGAVVDELTLDVPSGRRILQVTLSLLPHDRVQAYAIDITARKAAEELATQQRLESLGLVAGGIAHDFNNLLVGVLAEASAAREDRTLGEPAREALRRIEAAARRMAQLTRQLLAYSGRGHFTTVAIEPDELVGELHDQLVRIAGGQLAISPGAGGVVVEADAGLLRQVVVNLVRNAADAGGKRIAITTRAFQRDGTPFWQLEVSDDGAGIEPTALAHIFEPFFSTKPGHHGLGLSAVHGIVRRLGGDVEVDTHVGQGARFRVHLPVALGAEAVPRAQVAEQSTPVARLVGVRVLVADDEPSVRATVRRLLERRGAIVVVAADGSEAEARLRDESFALVVTDVSMPGCDGYEVLAIARATQPGIGVILMSGYTEKLRGQGGEEEADAFIEKPFTAKTLDLSIDEVLKGKR